MERTEKEDIGTDIRLLLECLDYQKDDPGTVKQSLMTLSAILQGTAAAKDVFREEKGLQKILAMVTKSREDEIVDTGLYCLGSAVERNVYSQKVMSTAGVFTFLHGLFSNRPISIRKKQTAAFLVLCLVSNNGYGQNLVRQSSCLHDIIALIRTSLPRNVKLLEQTDLQSEVCGGSTIDLWAALISTVCACVNNPINEDNQKICTSLIPYLLNVLSTQNDSIIDKPLLSLLGLTVSGNVSNQDRVRKCGGFEIFIKKLRHLLGAQEPARNPVLGQLLGTVDACITDNDMSSKRFGQLGGLTTILQLFTDCPMGVSEKTQAVLTLAHAVDACEENVVYVQTGGGMTVLIRQLTQCEDEELSKTIKYLLQLCVPSESGRERHKEESENISNFEAMKRHSDSEMLRKIQELDCKLKSLENSRSGLDFHDTPNRHSCDSPDRDQVQGSACSSHSFHQDCPTPREQSLIDQLIKERVEREKLERLNHMLQENICVTRSALVNPGGVCLEAVDIKNKSGKEKGSNGKSGGRSTEISNEYHVGPEGIVGKAATRSGQVYQAEGSQWGDTQNRFPELKQVHRALHLKYASDGFEKQDGSQRMVGNQCTSWDSSAPDLGTDNRTDFVPDKKYSRQDNRLYVQPTCIHKNASISSHGEDVLTEYSGRLPYQPAGNTKGQVVPCQGPRKMLGNSSRDKQAPDNIFSNDDVIFLNSDNTAAEVKTHSLSDVDKLPKPSVGAPVIKKSKVTLNRHAEIQCGTPFITPNQQTKDGSVTKTLPGSYNDGSSQTTPHVPAGNNTINTKNYDKEHNNLDQAKWSNSKTENSKTKLNTETERKTDCSPTHNLINDSGSSNLFLKPIAFPPRSKVRITPMRVKGLLSSELSQMDHNNSATDYDSDTSIHSEFDLALVRNIRKVVPIKKTEEKIAQKEFARPMGQASQVIKSQNNVKSIDKCVQGRDRNTADRWDIHPSTPLNRQPIPARPAFSDCGTRRQVFPKSPMSVASQGKRRLSLDDSGIHSPSGILVHSAKHSPVDSDIEGFRSSSDVSDEEVQVPNISAAVLRSSRRFAHSRSNTCLGCSGHLDSMKTGMLNSRTYNIALETDPNTCPLHRKLRQVERLHIHRVKKVEARKLKPTARLMKKLDKQKEKKRGKASVYKFSSSSNDELSDVSATEAEDNIPYVPQKIKRRRQRLEYTQAEVNSLLEGVSTMGRNWNSILAAYQFHPSRTNVDLKDKYKRMMAAEREAQSTVVSTKVSRQMKPFSMCEERRLRRGILKFGYHWKTILQSFTFAQGRTTEDLRNKWRTIHRKKGK